MVSLARCSITQRDDRKSHLYQRRHERQLTPVFLTPRSTPPEAAVNFIPTVPTNHFPICKMGIITCLPALEGGHECTWRLNKVGDGAKNTVNIGTRGGGIVFHFPAETRGARTLAPHWRGLQGGHLEWFPPFSCSRWIHCDRPPTYRH